MSRSRLPNEILLKIIEYIPYLCDEDISASTIFSLSLCSHQLHTITEPILYSSFKETSPTSLLSFLRTILKYPVLASYVRTYEGLDTRTIWQDATLHYPRAPSSLSQESCDEELESLIFSAIESSTLDMTLEDLWREDREGYVNGEWDAATALALCVLPNLSTFKVTYSQSRLYVEHNLRAMIVDSFRLPWINKCLFHLMHPTPTTSSLFPYEPPGEQPILTDMMLYAPFLSHDGPDPIILPPTTFSLHFTQNHSLHSFEVKDISCWIYDFDILDSPLLAQVHTLTLTNSVLPVISPRDFFARFPHLQNLHITSPSDVHLKAADHLIVLRHLQARLKTLTLHGPCSGDGIRDPSHSLFHFTALDSLDITVQHLEVYYPVGQPPGDDGFSAAPYWDPNSSRMVRSHLCAPFPQVLPTRLKTLILRWCRVDTVAKVLMLVDEQQINQASGRRLEGIYLEFLTAVEREDADDELDVLRAKCKVMGIELGVRSLYLGWADVPKGCLEF